VITDRDLEVLSALRDHADRGLPWARPRDVGGRSGSHHGKTLMKLERQGLAEVSASVGGYRRTLKYRVTQGGRDVLESVEFARRQEIEGEEGEGGETAVPA
jgi:hypothetical protein